MQVGLLLGAGAVEMTGVVTRSRHPRLRRRLWHMVQLLARGVGYTNELSERQVLLNRPWEEEYLHWGADGSLHGSRMPPARHHASTTSSGWCPGDDPHLQPPSRTS